MANYRSLHVKIWGDPDNGDLSPFALLLFTYLITNSHRNEACLYRRSVAQMAAETRLTEKQAGEALQELVAVGRVLYDNKTRTMWVKNAVRYQSVNTNCAKSIENDLAFCTCPELVQRFCEYYKGHETLYRVCERFINPLQTHGDGLPNPPYMLHGTGNTIQAEGDVGGGEPAPADDSPPTETEAQKRAQAEEIYQAWPPGFKNDKPGGLKAIRKAMKKRPAAELLAITKAYAQAVEQAEYRYVPNPATWFNQERYDQDPVTWVRGASANDGISTLNGLPPGYRSMAECESEKQRDPSLMDKITIYRNGATCAQYWLYNADNRPVLDGYQVSYVGRKP